MAKPIATIEAREEILTARILNGNAIRDQIYAELQKEISDLAASGVRPGEDLGRFPDEMRSLRTRAVPDLIGGYYASPAGWAAVGYDTFPGRCGELTRYTRPES